MEMRVDTMASGPGWRVHDILCSAGPRDRRFQEQHDSVCIAAVMQGSFEYRTTQGDATLAPGAILLGNYGQCFECGHEHAVGDRCLSFHFEPGCFETILSATPGVRSDTFSAARLPPTMALTPAVAAAEWARTEGDVDAWEEVAFDFAGEVVALLADHAASDGAASERDRQRIATVLRRIENEANNPLGLADLAREVAMSRYHFLRTFRQVVGVTPHQFILRTRLQNAAIALRLSVRPILDIALEAGFADLSTFNRRFRATMGMTPSTYRRAG
jgi:AraC family transcriptional regulator